MLTALEETELLFPLSSGEARESAAMIAPWLFSLSACRKSLSIAGSAPFFSGNFEVERTGEATRLLRGFPAGAARVEDGEDETIGVTDAGSAALLDFAADFDLALVLALAFPFGFGAAFAFAFALGFAGVAEAAEETVGAGFADLESAVALDELEECEELAASALAVFDDESGDKRAGFALGLKGVMLNIGSSFSSCDRDRFAAARDGEATAEEAKARVGESIENADDDDELALEDSSDCRVLLLQGVGRSGSSEKVSSALESLSGLESAPADKL